MDSASLIAHLVERIAAIKRPHPTRVAIDGIDAAGKTTFAGLLLDPLEKLGRQVIRASVDDFHNPRRVRLQRGSESPEGYYLDSFDYPALRLFLLEPLGPGGSLNYQSRAFDFRADAPINAPKLIAIQNAILLFDGVFLLRPELAGRWDYSIFLHVEFETSMQRARSRDAPLFGSEVEARDRHLRRYIPGQKIYLQNCQPAANADLVIDYNDPNHPKVLEQRAEEE